MTDIDFTTGVAPFDVPHRFLRTMNSRIANVGVELEMLSQGDDDYCRCDDWECPNDREDECECYVTCDYCEGLTSGPYGLDEILRLFSRAGVALGDDKHAYHCGCYACRYDRNPANSVFLATQSDCTVGVEFVSRILRTDVDEYHMDELDKVVQGLQRFYDLDVWEPDGYESAGNHIHVSWLGTDNGGFAFRGATRRQASALINAAYAAFDWEDVASGGCQTIRSYNSKTYASSPDKVGGSDNTWGLFSGSWTSIKGPTFEHRLWNTPRIASRIYDHIGISLALTRWAFATVLNSPMHRWWVMDSSPQQLVDHFSEHRAEFIEQVSMYIPDGPRFVNTADLLSNVA